jgi:signal transduction histidine kinase/response regulator RpfG family c-di-GMP phosphodiesterase
MDNSRLDPSDHHRMDGQEQRKQPLGSMLLSGALMLAGQSLLVAEGFDEALQASVPVAASGGTATASILLFDGQPYGRYGQVVASWHNDTPLALPLVAGSVYDDALFFSSEAVRMAIPLAGSDERLDQATLDALQGAGIRDLLVIPLVGRHGHYGAIVAQHPQSSGFDDENGRVWHAFANLAQPVTERLKLTRDLDRVSRALAQARDLDEIVAAIASGIRVGRVDQCWLGLYPTTTTTTSEPVFGGLVIRALWDNSGDQSMLGRQFTAQELPIIENTDTTQAWLFSNDTGGASPDIASATTLGECGTQSAIVLPIASGGAVLGWLFFGTRALEHDLTQEEVPFYRELAERAAHAIHRYLLQQQVHASRAEVEAVHRQYLRNEWSDFLQSKRELTTGVTYDFGELAAQQDIWHPLIEEAVTRGSPVTRVSPERSRDEHRHAENPALGTNGPEGGSSLVTPLKVRGEVIGALGLEDPDQTHDWTTDELDMIQEIADRVAQAVENARLLQETQASLAETEHLYSATGRLADASSAPDVVQILAREFHATLAPSYSGSILCSGPDPVRAIDWLEETAQWSPKGINLPQGHRFSLEDFPVFNRFLGKREPVVIKGTGVATSGAASRDGPAAMRSRTVIAIPLAIGDSWLGVSTITSDNGQIPDARTMRFLQNLADRAAVALESARLYGETQRRAFQLEAAARVSRAATSILEQDTLLSNVVELIREHFDLVRARVFLLDPTGNWAVLGASSEDDAQTLVGRGHALEVGGPTLVGYVTAAGEARISNGRFDAQHREAERESLGIGSELAIPLRIGERVIGALDVQSVLPQGFGPDDIPVLSTLGDQLAIAIENARLYQEQLETAEKLVEVDQLKNQFLANMSHELRTPLNSIIGFSRVILKGIDGPLTDLQAQDLNAIYNSGKLLLRLINDVLDISKIAAGKMELSFEQVDLVEIIRGVFSTTKALVKDKPEIELREKVPDTMPLITADATRIRQVLLNLMSNAAKFTEKGHIELSADFDHRYVTVKVKDSGVGIPVDKFDLIFQEFEQVDGSSTRTVGGTGLGLPISRHFVEMHGGRIWVESQVDVGSTFAIQLPIMGPSPEDEQAAEETIDPSRRLILAIDDDADVIKLYKRYLEKQNYQVIGLYQSEDALSKAREMQPFAILLDLLMPNKDGWAVIQELKSDPVTQDIPVIMCSIVGAAGRGFSMGAADFLVKPISEEKLMTALAHLENEYDSGSATVRQVLIIDDTPADRQLLRRTIETAQESYQVIEAGDGKQGVDIIQEQRPDLIILDLLMPEMDGFAVLEVLKTDQEMRRIPIIIVTAKDLTAQEQAEINGHVAALFRKGLFKEEELLQDLNLALHRARRRSENQKD